MVKRAETHAEQWHAMRLAERLLQERKRRHWTRQQVAETLGIAPISVYRWETGQVTPRSRELSAILALYEITLHEIDADQSSVWMIPFLRNQYFIGRVDVLNRLHDVLTSSSPVVVISQSRRKSEPRSRALSGLGGVGKTQIAVEYAHRYQREYDMALWALGDSRESLLTAYAEIAARLQLPGLGESNKLRLALAVKAHLETHEKRNWLLIVDNVDDLTMLKAFLPTRSMWHNGAILVTTRQRAVGKFMTRIDLDTFSQEESVAFLLRRVSDALGQRQDDLPESEREAARELFALMDGLPLALDQAAAYVEETGCSLAEYVALYRERRDELLRQGNAVDALEYPDSVATTWLMSFQRIEALHPAAAELLHLCAFLAPDAIAEEMLAAGAAALGPVLAPVAADAAMLHRAIEALRAYALVKRHVGSDAFAIHRLVQAVVQDAQTTDKQRLWAQRALAVVNAACPEVGLANWMQCERLMTQAMHVIAAIERHQLYTTEAARLSQQAGAYLQARGLNVDHEGPERLYQLALRIVKETLGPEDAQVGRLLDMLSAIYLGRGMYEEAERFSLQALQILTRRLGPEHEYVASSLNHLGVFYEEQGRYTEAEAMYQQVMTIYTARLGPRHGSTATGLFNLACVYHKRGQYAEAEPLYQQALDIWRQLLGPENPLLSHPLAGLGDLRREQGQYVEAEPLYQRALALWEPVDKAHPENFVALTGLAHLYHEQRRYVEAEPLYHRLIALCEQRAGMDHQLVAASLAGLAALYCDQGKFAKAESLLQRAQRICDQLVETHPARARTLLSLARLREAQGAHEEARLVYERLLALQELSLGGRHPQTIETRQRLSALL